jgi:hypothetical protein
MRWTTLSAGAIGVVAHLTFGSAAFAQANCNVLPHGTGRANCYGQQAQIYREQSRAYNGIAREQYRMHERVGTALRYAPVFGRPAAAAWNAPRYIYTYRQGRP